MRLFDNLGSGNGYKARLLLRQLGIPFERIEVDIDQGGSRTPEFLRINPAGRIPVLEYAPGRFLPESNAILWFLAEGTPYLPADKAARADVLRWMFFEQNSHEPTIATSRNWLLHYEIDEERRINLKRMSAGGYAALDTMERHLRAEPFCPFFAGGRYSIADIALYAYTHVADEGGFDLGKYQAIHAWLERVRSQTGHSLITQE